MNYLILHLFFFFLFSFLYLDLNISIEANQFVTKLYNKTDDFPFLVLRYPHVSSNAPRAACLGIMIGQWVRFLRASMKLQDFVIRARELVNNFMDRGYQLSSIQKVWKKFLQRHGAPTKFVVSSPFLTQQVFQM